MSLGDLHGKAGHVFFTTEGTEVYRGLNPLGFGNLSAIISPHQRQGAACFGTEVGGIDDLLTDATDLQGEGTDQGGTGFEMVDEVLDGVAIWRRDHIHGNLVALGSSASLDAHGFIIVEAGEGAITATDDEATAGLRLVDPGIGEGAPAGLTAAESVGVADDGDTVLIHLKSGRGVPGA